MLSVISMKLEPTAVVLTLHSVLQRRGGELFSRAAHVVQLKYVRCHVPSSGPRCLLDSQLRLGMRNAGNHPIENCTAS